MTLNISKFKELSNSDLLWIYYFTNFFISKTFIYKNQIFLIFFLNYPLKKKQFFQSLKNWKELKRKIFVESFYKNNRIVQESFKVPLKFFSKLSEFQTFCYDINNNYLLSLALPVPNQTSVRVKNKKTFFGLIKKNEFESTQDSSHGKTLLHGIMPLVTWNWSKNSITGLNFLKKQFYINSYNFHQLERSDRKFYFTRIYGFSSITITTNKNFTKNSLLASHITSFSQNFIKKFTSYKIFYNNIDSLFTKVPIIYKHINGYIGFFKPVLIKNNILECSISFRGYYILFFDKKLICINRYKKNYSFNYSKYNYLSVFNYNTTNLIFFKAQKQRMYSSTVEHSTFNR